LNGLATREKTRLWLLILIGVVATLLGQTHAREIFAPSQHASGVFSPQTQASIGENYDGIQYDALDSLLAAKGGGELVPMAENLYANGSIRNVAGFEVWGNAGKVGDAYNVNILGLYQAKGGATEGYLALSNALKAEARVAGASHLNITGNAIMNPGLMNLPSPILKRLGFTLETINKNTIFLTAPIK
jgi:hypothetical protein